MTPRAAAMFDPLTGLPNRTLMTEQLEQALRVARRERSLVALLFVDLDDFKEVNDRWGHAAGDALLQSIAGRLSGVLRDGDGVARLSGDEFIVTITGLRDPGYVDVVAQKVLEAVTAPVELEGRPVRVGASVGSAVFPSDATHATELLMLADTAMYRAKVQGKNRFVPFGADVVRARRGGRHANAPRWAAHGGARRRGTRPRSFAGAGAPRRARRASPHGQPARSITRSASALFSPIAATFELVRPEAARSPPRPPRPRRPPRPGTRGSPSRRPLALRASPRNSMKRMAFSRLGAVATTPRR